jgi:hypothetical protein
MQYALIPFIIRLSSFLYPVSKEEEHNIIGLPQIQINNRKFVAKILMTKYAI